MEHRETQIMIARALFPNMPQEVFDSWILPEIQYSGWPFRSSRDSIHASGWSAYLCDMSLDYWTALNWELYSVVVSQNLFHRDTLIRIHRVGVTATTQTRLTNVQNSSERFWA